MHSSWGGLTNTLYQLQGLHHQNPSCNCSHLSESLPNGVKSAFLNGWLDEEIFVSNLKGIRLKDRGPNSTRLLDFKKELHKEFEMTDLGEMSFFLGMEVWQSPYGIFISQERYANELSKICKENCKPVNTPLMQNVKLCKNDGAAKLMKQVQKHSWVLVDLTAIRPDIMLQQVYS
ncbi:uncharacterized protein LOC116105712 [Pistacia vera]|uniref:uncharacterized protein LOC116105712 n=1 Tax=Pistacia vera TaxID=55513 RepID=UPI001263AF14|nr:uncharacterized protein LOC116105712 [Pistacia vera]